MLNLARATLILSMTLMLGLALGGGPARAHGPQGQTEGSGVSVDQDAMPGTHHGYGQGQGQVQPWTDHQGVLDGEPFSFAGPIVGVDYPAGGMAMATGDGQVAVHGLGPAWYWELHGLDWPRVGDQLRVEGYMVDYSGAHTNLAMSITIADGRGLELRNPDTGWPLWMQ